MTCCRADPGSCLAEYTHTRRDKAAAGLPGDAHHGSFIKGCWVGVCEQLLEDLGPVHADDIPVKREEVQRQIRSLGAGCFAGSAQYAMKNLASLWVY